MGTLKVCFNDYIILRAIFNTFLMLDDEEETESCQKGCKRKSGASEAAVETEENSEKKAKLEEAEEDPATAEPQFVEA
jgi:hypothetical protein